MVTVDCSNVLTGHKTVLLRTKKATLPLSPDFWGVEDDDPIRGFFDQLLSAYGYFGIEYEDDPYVPLFLPGKIATQSCTVCFTLLPLLPLFRVASGPKQRRSFGFLD